MFRLIQEAIAKLSFEEISAMTHKSKDDTELQALKAVQEERNLSDTVSKLRSQISEQEKEMSEIRKVNKKLEKRNKNLKDSIEKLIEEKRQIQELSKVIDEQKAKIEGYEKEIDNMKNIQKAAEEKPTSEKRSTSPQSNKYKTTDPQLLQKQIELLSGKNLELKAELDRRTRISDQMKREHEAALKDRNELLTEVKILKQQVDDMRHRLDRSLALLVKKRKGVKDTEDTLPDTTSSTISESLLISSKGTQTQRERSPTKIPVANNNRKSGGGRLILNSVAKVNPKDSNKKGRLTSSQQKPGPNISAESSTVSKDISEKARKTDASHVTISESIQQVKGKRVVSDIRSKLEKRKLDKEYVLNIDEYPTPTNSTVSPVQSADNNQRRAENIMDLFEVIDDGNSCPRKV